MATGPVLIDGRVTDLAFLETSNGGTGGPGVVTTALSLETGAKLWQFGYVYPSSPRGVDADLPLPATGIPGGAVAVDLDHRGQITDVVFGDLYGDLWRLDASDGTSRNGTAAPLFAFSTNRHPIGAPPAIYASGTEQIAVVASGGYADPSAAGWATSTQYLIGARLSGTGAPVSELAAACATCALTLDQPLAAGDRGFAQARVVGARLSVTTDSTDVNLASFGSVANTGHVTVADLTVVDATPAKRPSVAEASKPRLTRAAWLRAQ